MRDYNSDCLMSANAEINVHVVRRHMQRRAALGFDAFRARRLHCAVASSGCLRGSSACFAASLAFPFLSSGHDIDIITTTISCAGYWYKLRSWYYYTPNGWTTIHQATNVQQWIARSANI